MTRKSALHFPIQHIVLFGKKQTVSPEDHNAEYTKASLQVGTSSFVEMENIPKVFMAVNIRILG